MGIFDIPENYLSNVDCKLYMRKLHTSSLKSSSTLSSRSIREMYNIFNHAQKQCLMLNSYIPGIHSLIYPKRPYKFYFLKN